MKNWQKYIGLAVVFVATATWGIGVVKDLTVLQTQYSNLATKEDIVKMELRLTTLILTGNSVTVEAI